MLSAACIKTGAVEMLVPVPVAPHPFLLFIIIHYGLQASQLASGYSIHFMLLEDLYPHRIQYFLGV